MDRGREKEGIRRARVSADLQSQEGWEWGRFRDGPFPGSDGFPGARSSRCWAEPYREVKRLVQGRTASWWREG